jgi:hypothetical protein
MGVPFQLSQMHLHTAGRNIHPGQAIIPTMKSDAVIPDFGRHKKHIVQTLIPFTTVAFEDESFYIGLLLLILVQVSRLSQNKFSKDKVFVRLISPWLKQGGYAGFR